jgi:hypothetical protein
MLTKFLIRIPIGKSADFSHWVIEKKTIGSNFGAATLGYTRAAKIKARKDLKTFRIV